MSSEQTTDTTSTPEIDKQIFAFKYLKKVAQQKMEKYYHTKKWRAFFEMSQEAEAELERLRKTLKDNETDSNTMSSEQTTDTTSKPEIEKQIFACEYLKTVAEEKMKQYDYGSTIRSAFREMCKEAEVQVSLLEKLKGNETDIIYSNTIVETQNYKEYTQALKEKNVEILSEDEYYSLHSIINSNILNNCKNLDEFNNSIKIIKYDQETYDKLQEDNWSTYSLNTRKWDFFFQKNIKAIIANKDKENDSIYDKFKEHYNIKSDYFTKDKYKEFEKKYFTKISNDLKERITKQMPTLLEENKPFSGTTHFLNVIDEESEPNWNSYKYYMNISEYLKNDLSKVILNNYHKVNMQAYQTNMSLCVNLRESTNRQYNPVYNSKHLLKHKHLFRLFEDIENEKEIYSVTSYEYNYLDYILKIKKALNTSKLKQIPSSELERCKFLFQVQQVLASIPHYSNYNDFNKAAKQVLGLQDDFITVETFNMYSYNIKKLQNNSLLQSIISRNNVDPIELLLRNFLATWCPMLITGLLSGSILYPILIFFAYMIPLYVRLQTVRLQTFKDTSELYDNTPPIKSQKDRLETKFVIADDEIITKLTSDAKFSQIFQNNKIEKPSFLEYLVFVTPRNIDAFIEQNTSKVKGKPQTFAEREQCKKPRIELKNLSDQTPQNIDLHDIYRTMIRLTPGRIRM